MRSIVEHGGAAGNRTPVRLGRRDDCVVDSTPSADGGLRDGVVSWQRPIAVGVDTPASLAQHGGDGPSGGAEAAS